MKLAKAMRLLAVDLPQGNRNERALAKCHSVEDLRSLAARHLPRSVFDYVDGGADEEQSLTANTLAFREHSFTPSILKDVSSPVPGTEILGRPAAAPLGFAPTGYTRMISPAGEPAVARAAARRGLPYTLSTMATTSLEELAAADTGADLWFQLYFWKDRARTLDLVRRAGAGGYRVLEVAVDTAVPGFRTRDVRNGLTIPPRLTPGTILDIASKPGYWTRMLRSPELEFANVSGAHGYSIDNIGAQFDASVTWDDLERLRSEWDGKLLLKGPVSPADALKAQAMGLDGVHLSNHGGRQLDRSVPPAQLIHPVREAVGHDFTVLVDSGVRHGADIATAVALGADAALIGRPYLWALAVAGEAGIDRLAELLINQFSRTMQLLGTASVAELRECGPSLLASHRRLPH